MRRENGRGEVLLGLVEDEGALRAVAAAAGTDSADEDHK